jgi:hypothetical protein
MGESFAHLRDAALAVEKVVYETPSQKSTFKAGRECL